MPADKPGINPALNSGFRVKNGLVPLFMGKPFPFLKRLIKKRGGNPPRFDQLVLMVLAETGGSSISRFRYLLRNTKSFPSYTRLGLPRSRYW